MRNTHYTVTVGRKTGVFNCWSACEDQVKGYPGARYKGFTSRAAAEKWYHENKNEAVNDWIRKDHHNPSFTPPGSGIANVIGLAASAMDFGKKMAGWQPISNVPAPYKRCLVVYLSEAGEETLYHTVVCRDVSMRWFEPNTGSQWPLDMSGRIVKWLAVPDWDS